MSAKLPEYGRGYRAGYRAGDAKGARRLRRENAALREDKERLDWIIGEAHYLFFKELASDLAKGRQQIDAARKEAQP